MALPALSRLLQLGLVAGVGMAKKNTEIAEVVKGMCSVAHTPFFVLEKKTFAKELSDGLLRLKPDMVLVKTFPWKIPGAILKIPVHGFINFHYAPLPEWKGANPLFWMIRNGAKEAGVTVHRMEEEMDAGPILLKKSFPLAPDSTFGLLCTQLAYAGLELTERLLMATVDGSLKATPQDQAKGNWYKRPSPADLQINWSTMNASEISALVRACNPWNKGVPVRINNWMIGLTYVTEITTAEVAGMEPGTVLTLDEKNGMQMVCAKNTCLRADVVYTEEGFIPGSVLARFGISCGMKVHTIADTFVHM